MERNNNKTIHNRNRSKKINNGYLHILYLDNERFQIRKKERPVMCKRYLQFGHPKKYCWREDEYCKKSVRSLQKGEKHQCREMNCFYCIIKDTEKCNNYNKELNIMNKIMEKKCDMYEAKKFSMKEEGKKKTEV